MLKLNGKEVKALLEYFTERAGYISYEFDSEIHNIIKRFQEYEEDNSEEVHPQESKEQS